MGLWILAGLLILVLAVALQLIGFHVQQQRLMALHRRLEAIEVQLAMQGQSIGALTTGAQGVDRRLARLEARERVLSERQDAFESQQADERPYHQAIRLVQQGAGVRRLVEELELSESEADLIVRLHGASRAAQAADL
jgi:uncharacterized coiled-coil protein SlyX